MLRGVPGWERWEWIVGGFSVRFGGVSRGLGVGAETGLLNLGFTREDGRAAVEENRRRLVGAVGEATGQEWSLAVLRQVHGIGVREITAETLAEAMPGGRGAWEADGMITRAPGVLLGVGAADCVPVLVADLRLRVVGGFHAGWRGTAAGMAGEGLRRMGEAFGTRAEDCVAAVGPSIGACCYEVGEEVREAFGSGCGAAARGTHLSRDETAAKMGHPVSGCSEGGVDRAKAAGEDRGTVFMTGEAAGKWRLDLWEANRRQLVRAGVPAGAVTVMGECTACSRDENGQRRYFSHRAEGGRTGRMLGVIGVRSGVRSGGAFRG